MQRRIISGMALLVLLTATVAANAAVEGKFERTLKVPGMVDMEIATGSGDINVRTGPSGTVQITGYVRSSTIFGGQERIDRVVQNPPIVQTGGIIRIGRNIDENFLRNVSIRYDVVVPAETVLKSSTGSGSQTISGLKSPLKATTGSGEIRVNSINGSVRLSTGSGGIEIADISGSVSAQTGSGEIKARNIGTADMTTGSGEIEITGLRGGVHARTGSGSVHVQGEATSGWQLHTASGDVRAQVGPNAKFDIDAGTSSGDIRVAQSMTTERRDRHHLRGKVNGGGNLIEIQTSSGDIEVQ